MRHKAKRYRNAHHHGNSPKMPILNAAKLDSQTSLLQLQRVKEKHENLLLKVLGIRAVEVKHTQGEMDLWSIERFGKYMCVTPSPLRKCWTIVGEDGPGQKRRRL